MTLSARRRLIAVLAVLTAAAVVVLVIDLQGDDAPPRSGIDIPAGRERAEAACASADEVFRIVQEDGPAPDVLGAAEAAKREGALARDNDPLWSTLASGADALLEGLRTDNARAAGVGRRILDTQCARLRARLPSDAG